MKLYSCKFKGSAIGVLPFSECWSCSDVALPGRLLGALLGLGNLTVLFCRNDRALDAAGGLENLLYCDANPAKVRVYVKLDRWCYTVMLI